MNNEPINHTCENESYTVTLVWTVLISLGIAFWVLAGYGVIHLMNCNK